MDFEKAFDRVRHELMMERLIDLGVGLADLRVLMDLHWNRRQLSELERIRAGGYG